MLEKINLFMILFLTKNNSLLSEDNSSFFVENVNFCFYVRTKIIDKTTKIKIKNKKNFTMTLINSKVRYLDFSVSNHFSKNFY